ncbi:MULTISPECIES: alpha/beta hydrolase [unclassified Haladaptatus]|uniref:alpha/beta hydrolase family protein n=1 Tax=unclassified Haladaptatus TaxID=2622732 RepID=UPI00209C5212|nr:MULTISPECIES: alpha/beta hydrolase [unclassified Haladaptatus]MCO8242650.1 alpha/beta hydrolase [Haladaptatus sp. AB643]MCO8252410.1 alpha/beta hydrolase [Haladaptatus sp. AB618]
MSETPTRRRLLRAVGVAATATLAGCSSGGKKESTSTGTPDGKRTTKAGAGTGTTETGSGTETSTSSATDEETTSETTTQETGEETTTGTAPPEGGGDVQFTTQSGATVHGTLVGDGSCGIVFAHDNGFDRKDWLPEAKELANKGYTCLPIGLNLDDTSTAPGYVLAASRYLRKRVGVKNVVLVGAGAGADAVVRANARAKSGTIAGTLALAPGSGVDSAGEMQGWKLFVVAKGDDRQYVQTTKKMQKAASNPKRYQTVNGSAHGQHVFEENENAMMSMVNSLLMTVCG